MAREHDDSMMNNLYWWGVPTLFRCPHIGILDKRMKDADIALVVLVKLSIDLPRFE